MSRYIDAEWLGKHISYVILRGETQVSQMIRANRLGDAPSIDIVRCKECKYWQDNLTEDNSDEDYLMCKWNIDETPDADDFCSYGERRE